MSVTDNKNISAEAIDASCRVPLLALFGGAALWLVLGVLMGIVAAMSFHNPDMFANCPCLNYGHAIAAANDLLLYGFVVPAALGVMLWIFARLSQAPLALPIVPVAAANIWHVGVLVGTVGILMGDTTGHAWLEYPRPAAVLLFAGFMLTAVSAAGTMGFRAIRELYPAHWFLFASLLWFVWAYSSANLFLLSSHPPRGVVQAIIDWWFTNNLLFVWLGLAGVGISFYFLPKLAGKPLAGTGYVGLAFFMLIFVGSWCGVPPDAPVPAWLPAISAFAALLMFLPVLGIGIVAFHTVISSGFKMQGSPFCFIRFGTMSFVITSLLYLAEFCPHANRLLGFTWYNFAVSQWQILGFIGMILLGSIYYILPRIMGGELPFPKLASATFWCFVIGLLLYAVPLLIGGVEQGLKLRDPNVAFAQISATTLNFIRISTLGQVGLLLGALFLLLNVFVMTIRWKLGLLKSTINAVKAPLEGVNS